MTTATREFWLPSIPSDWKMAAAWSLFSEGTEKCRPTDQHLTPSRIYGVIPQAEYIARAGHRVVANDLSSHNMKHVEPDDFIISMGSFESGIEHSTLEGKVSGDYRVLRPTDWVYPRFYRWFFKSAPLIDALRGLTTEIRVGQRIHYSRFSTLSLPLPPLETQRAIADYLDRETAEIDSMLAELDDLVALLEERRLVVLEESTRALFDSWACAKSELLVDIRTGSADTKDANPDGAYPFYVRSDHVECSTDWEFDCEAVLTAGDGAGVGKVFHRARGKFMAHQRVYVMCNFRNISRDYYFHIFKALFPKVARDGSAKSTVDSVRRGMISDLKIPLPPEEVQQAFVREMSDVDEHISSMLSDAAELKSLLLERRSALITDVVTGRKQVV